jgi:hypothetical protein
VISVCHQQGLLDKQTKQPKQQKLSGAGAQLEQQPQLLKQQKLPPDKE